MLERLAVVWLTYITRPSLVTFGGLLLVFSVLFGVVSPGISRFYGSEKTSLYWLMLPLAMVVGFSGMVASGQLIVQFQTPTARLLPRFAMAHLLIAMGLLAVAWCLGVTILARGNASWPVCLLGASVTVGVAAIGLADAFPGDRQQRLWRNLLWAAGGGPALICAVLALAYSSTTELNEIIRPWHAGLAILQLGLLGSMVARLLPQSSRCFAEVGGRGLPMGVAGFEMPLGTDLPSRRGGFRGRWRSEVSNLELAGYHGQRWLRRLRLWQAGGAPGVLNTLMQLPLLLSPILIASYNQSLIPVVMVAGITVFTIVVQLARQRQPRFPQEWLRPVSRNTAVDDYLRGMALDLIPYPIVVGCACIWHVVVNHAPADWEFGSRILTILPTTYVLALGIAAVLSLVRTTFSFIFGGVLFGGPLASLAGLFAPPDLGSSLYFLFIPIGLVNLTVGIALTVYARRRWLHRELL